MQTKLTRRTFLQVAGGTVLTASLAGCFGVGSGQTTTGGSSSTVTIWDIRTGAEQKVVQTAVDTFNSTHPGIHATINFFQNDPYKQKLQVAMAHTTHLISSSVGAEASSNPILTPTMSMT